MSHSDLSSRKSSQTQYAADHHLRLAQKYYVARVTELRELIAAEEAKFKFVLLQRCEGGTLTRSCRQLVAEIDEIRSGAWDDRIRESIGSAPERVKSVEVPPESPPPETVAPPGEESVEIAEAEVPPEPHQEPQAVRNPNCHVTRVLIDIHKSRRRKKAILEMISLN